LGIAPAGEHELRSGRHLVGQALEDGDRSRLTQEMNVVEHQRERQRSVREHIAETGKTNADEVGFRHCQGSERLRIE
jgi:hypothetical protein